ncbi:hypothetical protein ACRALDRAFT_2129748 [Sodiomyces alcalophilus JCM 7366]|uniref:uncharacterized protein n=1 Tax=Sodiomyces alcalophilus JCM 7366 TaxID=591952 RepID=UPI0039B55094
MHWSTVILGAVALAGSAAAQGTFTYTDAEGRTFLGYTDTAGIRYGIAIPEGAIQGSYDAIIQITAPNSIGWASLAWGGSMTYNPLTVVWPNGDDVQVSSRMAFGYGLPPLYDDLTHYLLPGSGTNDTHFVATALCIGCTSWSPPGADPTDLDPDAANPLAFAYSTVSVTDPDDIDTTFAQHDAHGWWSHDFSQAQHPDFYDWFEGIEFPCPTQPDPTTSAEPTSSIPLPTPTDDPEPLPVPNSCPGVGAFRSGFGVANGWKAVKIAGNLRTPRGIVLDSRGNLLVVQSGLGVTVHTFGSDGCIASSKTLIANPALNHGIGLTADGRTLYVTSMTTAFEYSYDPDSQTVSNERIVVTGMIQGGHPTRALIIPPAYPHLLVISLGSYDNIDHPTIDPAVGRAIVKVFDMRDVPQGGYRYNTQGYLLGYGLRNGVALAADGNSHIWEVENGADQFERTVNGYSYDIHADNPAEELNYLGDPAVENTNWYGYPTCHTIFGAEQLTDAQFQTGDQFVLAPNATFSDADCARRGSVPARLSFQAHSAPMDAIFDRDFENLFITFHGSWNRPQGAGYKVVQVPYTRNPQGLYEPVDPPNSRTAARDVFWSENEASCTSFTCFRPCGIVFDQAYSRLFVASDRPAEGELFMLARV